MYKVKLEVNSESLLNTLESVNTEVLEVMNKLNSLVEKYPFLDINIEAEINEDKFKEMIEVNVSEIYCDNGDKIYKSNVTVGDLTDEHFKDMGNDRYDIEARIEKVREEFANAPKKSKDKEFEELYADLELVEGLIKLASDIPDKNMEALLRQHRRLSVRLDKASTECSELTLEQLGW